MSMFRTLLSMSGGGGLPSEYQQVEYIQSTGTQYIDTGYIASHNICFEIGVTKVRNTNKSCLICGTTLWDDNTYMLYEGDDGSLYWAYMGPWGTDNLYPIPYNTNELTNLKIYRKTIIKNDTYINNDNSANYNLSGNFRNIYIGRHYVNGHAWSGKIHYCKIWDDNILVRDFVPCYRKSDNVIGLYDLVDNVFYTNAGSGTFIKGDDV